MDEIAIQFLKTYQVWHHRRLLITLLSDPSSAQEAKTDVLELATTELDFIAQVLQTDAKNYHTWSYRQWLLAHFDDPALWLGELPYVNELLDDDVRNNSAWHHRFFIVFGRGGRAGATPGEAGEVLRREIRYVMFYLVRLEMMNALSRLAQLYEGPDRVGTKQPIGMELSARYPRPYTHTLRHCCRFR